MLLMMALNEIPFVVSELSQTRFYIKGETSYYQVTNDTPVFLHNKTF